MCCEECVALQFTDILYPEIEGQRSQIGAASIGQDQATKASVRCSAGTATAH